MSISIRSRIRGAFLAHATLDALGGPVEFRSRGSFPLVTEMLPNDNFSLPAGCFTDDTSMALCLAQSLLENGPKDLADQAKRYLRWWRKGENSSVGKCFDIGLSTSGALARWEKLLGRGEGEADIMRVVRKDWGKDVFCGNGSLMRVLPVALLYEEGQVAEEVAKWSSRITHPHERCVLSCVLFVRLVGLALEGKSKQELVGAVAAFVDKVKGDGDVDKTFVERFEGYRSMEDWEKRQETQISSSGYVIDSLEAALWAFFTTSTLREGGMKAVNLGDDADTVGAIHGGLAGAFYGEDAIPEEWLAKMMKKISLVAESADRILEVRG